jgi:glycerol uptake facilitator-like aquaporin
MTANGFRLSQRVMAEFLGTAFLLAVVVGSGIMGERLAAENMAVALLANSVATGAGLVALIYTFGPISGAHLNPVVTLCTAGRGDFPWRETPHYLLAQLAGAVIGVACAHLMFEQSLYAFSAHARTGAGQWLSEFIATVGLLTVITSCSRSRTEIVPLAVGTYIAAAYWFTASTSFANPAVTLARALTDSFSGIRPIDVLPFVAAQGLALVCVGVWSTWLTRAPVAEGRTETAVTRLDESY